MSGTPYLHELTVRLAIGAANLDPSIKKGHGDWLVAQQRSDGGFAGREGESDPYYTAFALRALWIIDRLDESIVSRAAEFLRGRLTRRDSIIDLISLIFAAAICELSVGEVVLSDTDDTWRDNVAELLESLRTQDGGYAKTPEGRAGSTYQTFLNILCLQLIDKPVPDCDAVVSFLQSQAAVDGGFREIRAAKRPGINPTAAAIGSLKAIDKLQLASDAGGSIATADFILDQQSDEGGLAANTRIPFADLLSSFTGLLTLVDLEAADQADVAAIKRYALSMQSPGGGFVGFALDQTADVEYTFYGLAALSLCESLLAK